MENNTFLALHTSQFNNLIGIIEDLMPRIDYKYDGNAMIVREFQNEDNEVLHIAVFRDLHYKVNGFDITVAYDREVLVDDKYIRDQRQLDRILQIIRCCVPKKPSPVGVKVSGITAADEWITPDFSDLEPDLFEFV